MILHLSEEVVADPVGPLPETPEGYTYLLVLADRASRWTEGFPMVSNSAEHLLAAFLMFIWRRGCPKILYSDRGGNLLSFLAYKVYQSLGVTKVSGSSHRHNVSGLGESTIQSVMTMLTCDRAIAQYHLKLVPAGAAGPLECEYKGLGLDGRSRAPLWLHPYLLRLCGWRRSSVARHLRQQIL